MMHVVMLVLGDMQSLLLENPLGLVGVAVAVAFVGAHQATSHKRKAGWVVAAISLAAGVSVYVSAAVIETDREAIVGRTVEAAVLTEIVDTESLRQIFTSSGRVTGPGGKTWMTVDEVIDHFENRENGGFKHDRIQIDQVNLREGGFAESFVTMRTQVERSPYPRGIDTRWRINWRKGNDGIWRVEQAAFLEIQGRAPDRKLAR